MDASHDPADIGSVMIFDGPLDEGRVRNLLAERLAPHVRFRQRVVDAKHKLTSPSWADEPNFSIDAHVDRCCLDVPLGTSVHDALASRFSYWMSEPIDLERSPWRAHLVDLPDGSWAHFTRLHHCMGDGFALLHVLLGMADPDGVAAPAMSSGAAVRDTWIRRAVTAERDIAAVGHLLRLSSDHVTPLRALRSGIRRLAWSRPFPLAEVKRNARQIGATINDVLVSAIAGALRRWLEERGGAEPIRAVVPVNLRPPDVPVDMHHGNWFGLVFLDLPTDVTTETERILAVHRAMDRLKKTREAHVVLGMLSAIGRAPAVVDRVVDAIFARKASVVITNVPGPRARLRFADRELRDMWFWAPPCGLGLGASLLSYAGNVYAGIRADAAIMSEPDLIARWFVDELAHGTE